MDPRPVSHAPDNDSGQADPAGVSPPPFHNGNGRSNGAGNGQLHAPGQAQGIVAGGTQQSQSQAAHPQSPFAFASGSMSTGSSATVHASQPGHAGHAGPSGDIVAGCGSDAGQGFAGAGPGTAVLESEGCCDADMRDTAADGFGGGEAGVQGHPTGAADPVDDGPILRVEELPGRYTPRPGAWDEMVRPDGRVRGHWRPLMERLLDQGFPELERRWAVARRLIRDNGVTYNVYSDLRGQDRPWSFDPLPMMVPPAEWDRLSEGIRQRSRLLELLADDIYGAQSLLAEGLLPPELILANPAFLRACHGLRPAGERRLHLVGVDMLRDAAGTWRVYGDRTQAPSGAGYALENRIVVSRMIPEVYRESRVRRLAPFFRTFRDTLRAIAPRRRDEPRIVLLTPGPYNETYFEHAYLARYLGFTLVEGGDLTVRDGCVYLKQLGGLQPVDVILRRLDDDWCDPLELRGTSVLGVPGLVQAVRAGNVAVANGLGTGVLETPALAGYLPALCKRLLGEPLKLAGVPTLWCGDPAALRRVLGDLRRYVIKPTFPTLRMEPTFGDALSEADRRRLADRIAARPDDYTAQEQVGLSTAPAFTEAGLQPRHMALRMFAAADGTGFTVMPGGLCRVAPQADTPVVSIQRGGGSKDAWVPADGPVPFVSLLAPPDKPMELSRGGDDLPSRVADNLFWLGRYLERTESTARMLRVSLSRPLDLTGADEAATLLRPTAPDLLAEAARVMPAWKPPAVPRSARPPETPATGVRPHEPSPDAADPDATDPTESGAGQRSGTGAEGPAATSAGELPVTGATSGRRPAEHPAEAAAPPPASHAAGVPRVPADTPDTAALPAIVAAMIYDRNRADSLVGTLEALQRVTRTVRDRLSAEAWRILNGLTVGEPPQPAEPAEADGSLSTGTGDAVPGFSAEGALHLGADPGRLMQVLNDIVAGLSAFCGLMMDSMTRGQGWRFLDLGRRLERALSMVGLLRAGFGRRPAPGGRMAVPPAAHQRGHDPRGGSAGAGAPAGTRSGPGESRPPAPPSRGADPRAPEASRIDARPVAAQSASDPDGPPLEAMLEVADSIMTYRRRYLAGPQAGPVLDLLLADESNPRSLAYQLAMLVDHVSALPGERSRPVRSLEHRLLIGMLAEVRLADVQEELARPGGEGNYPALMAMLDRCLRDLPGASESLTRHYMSHAPASRRLTAQHTDHRGEDRP